MPLIDSATARRFAEQWIDAWNRHDLDAVLAHYAEDFEFASPLIVAIAQEDTGALKGKAAVRAYWEKGLRQLPDLNFQLIDVLTGINQATLYYRGHRGMVAETFVFDGAGQVFQATACYSDAAIIQSASMPPVELPALDPASLPARTTSIYPTEELRARITGRSKQALGDALGLRNYGVNRVALAPGGVSALRHWHTRQDEFIHVLEGEITLVTDEGEQCLDAGMCAGFPAGKADGHQLVNRSDRIAVYLEVGDRLPGDEAHYPDEDLKARAERAAYAFFHKDDTPY